MPVLTGRYRIVAPNLRGVGGSTSPSRDYSKTAPARDLHAFVQTLNASRVIVVGHDIGGMVAYDYARQFPGDVAGAVILDVPLPGFAPWDDIAASPHAWHYDFHAQQPLAEELVAGRQATYFRYFVDRTAGNAKAIDDQEIARFARAYQSPAQLSAGFGFYRTFEQDKRFNLAERGSLNVPLLIVGADRSLGEGTAARADGLRARGAITFRPPLLRSPVTGSRKSSRLTLPISSIDFSRACSDSRMVSGSRCSASSAIVRRPPDPATSICALVTHAGGQRWSAGATITTAPACGFGRTMPAPHR